MNLLKQAVRQAVASRWFPTVTKPIISGLVASGIILILHAVGVTQIVPAEVNAVVAPMVGFLVTAMVQRTGTTPSTPAGHIQVTVATHSQVGYKPGPTLGSTIAQTLLDDVAREIDSDPTLVQSVAAEALGRVLGGVAVAHGSAVAASVVKAAQEAHEVVTTGNEASHTN